MAGQVLSKEIKYPSRCMFMTSVCFSIFQMVSVPVGGRDWRAPVDPPPLTYSLAPPDLRSDQGLPIVFPLLLWHSQCPTTIVNASYEEESSFYFNNGTETKKCETKFTSIFFRLLCRWIIKSILFIKYVYPYKVLKICYLDYNICLIIPVL